MNVGRFIGVQSFIYSKMLRAVDRELLYKKRMGTKWSSTS